MSSATASVTGDGPDDGSEADRAVRGPAGADTGIVSARIRWAAALTVQ
ncbi:MULTISPECIES: hypothetical protein [unclassified Streptomyces]